MSGFAEPGFLDRCLAGDEGALRELVVRHQGLVYGVALAVTGDPSLAEDVSQETFVEAWRHLPSLRNTERPGAWLAGIARNLARSALRRRHRPRLSTPETRGPPDPGGMSSEGPATPLEEMLLRESRLVVRECLAGVPESLREALVLFYLKEQSVRQVAQELGVSEELVKQRLSRGRRFLREGVAEVLGASLDRARPGPALAGSILAALTDATRTAWAPGLLGKAGLQMSIKKTSVAVVAVALAGTGIWFGRSLTAGQPPPASTWSGSGEALAGAAPASGQSPPASATPAASGWSRGRSHQAAWRRLREVVRQARQRREGERAPSTTAPPPSRGGAVSGTASDQPGSLDKDTIQGAIRAILPLIKECYEQALGRAGGTASKGRVVVSFRIEGEPEVGGVVSESAVNADKSTLADPLMQECVQESMYALQLPPPRNGGVVKVTYPFVFSAGEPGRPAPTPLGH